MNLLEDFKIDEFVDWCKERSSSTCWDSAISWHRFVREFYDLQVISERSSLVSGGMGLRPSNEIDIKQITELLEFMVDLGVMVRRQGGVFRLKELYLRDELMTATKAVETKEAELLAARQKLEKAQREHDEFHGD
jgi:hypothetical protein